MESDWPSPAASCSASRKVHSAESHAPSPGSSVLLTTNMAAGTGPAKSSTMASIATARGATDVAVAIDELLLPHELHFRTPKPKIPGRIPVVAPHGVEGQVSPEGVDVTKRKHLMPPPQEGEERVRRQRHAAAKIPGLCSVDRPDDS
jgi:hypothetical protein